MSMKVCPGKEGPIGKWALRQILYKHVPRYLIDRPKVGFAMPIGQWFRGPLREWAEDLLEPGLMKRQSYFAPNRFKRCGASISVAALITQRGCGPS